MLIPETGGTEQHQPKLGAACSCLKRVSTHSAGLTLVLSISAIHVAQIVKDKRQEKRTHMKNKNKKYDTVRHED